MKYLQQEQLYYFTELVGDALCSALYTIAVLPSQERNDSEKSIWHVSEKLGKTKVLQFKLCVSLQVMGEKTQIH